MSESIKLNGYCKDLTNKRFTRLVAIKPIGKSKHGRVIWECKCDCGKTVKVESIGLLSGNTKSCGCYMRENTSKRNTKDITGKRFGRLTAIRVVGKKPNGGCYLWYCECDCGGNKVVDVGKLQNGDTKSCGCLVKEGTLGINKKHGWSGTVFYQRYVSAHNRCNNPKDVGFSNYGGRGIKFEWDSFEAFKEDMYESYQKHCEEFGEYETTLDRIDVNGNYSKENCRWATRKEQANNKRNNHFIKLNGRELTVMEASEITGIKYRTILSRLGAGKDIYGKGQTV